jgi:adenylate kinase
MDLVFLGPPGAGKGTQAKRAAGRLGVAHVSTGDLLREAVRSATLLGVQARACMDRGELVPDAVVDEMVAAKAAAPECRSGLLLDGYPRNVAQAQALDRIESGLGRQIAAVVLLEVSDAVLEERLTGRRSCPKDGMMYHVTANPPRQTDRCDACGSPLAVRSDDRPDVVRDRLRVYHRETEPVIEYYRSRGLLRNVNGSLGIDETTNAVLMALGRD